MNIVFQFVPSRISRLVKTHVVIEQTRGYDLESHVSNFLFRIVFDPHAPYGLYTVSALFRIHAFVGIEIYVEGAQLLLNRDKSFAELDGRTSHLLDRSQVLLKVPANLSRI